MKIRSFLSAALLTTTSQTAMADTLSFAIGGGVWNADPSGSFRIISTGEPAVDVKGDLFWDEESQGYLFATLEHPVPLLPNVRLSTVTLDYSGTNPSPNFSFDGNNFTGPPVTSEISIDQTDLLLYYEVLDNVVSLDLGLNIRALDLDYNITDGTSTSTDSASETVPMVYALIGASPWPDFILSLEGNIISYDGNKITDITAKVAYTTNFFVGFEAGYRTQTLELDDVDDVFGELDFDGLFAGAYLKF